jgi:fructuronate reductase
LSFRDIFPAEMAENAHLTDALTRAYAALEARGAHACVKEYADA